MKYSNAERFAHLIRRRIYNSSVLENSIENNLLFILFEVGNRIRKAGVLIRSCLPEEFANWRRQQHPVANRASKFASLCKLTWLGSEKGRAKESNGKQWWCLEVPGVQLPCSSIYCLQSSSAPPQMLFAVHTFRQFVITSARLRRFDVAPPSWDLFMQKRFNLIINPHDGTFKSFLFRLRCCCGNTRAAMLIVKLILRRSST